MRCGAKGLPTHVKRRFDSYHTTISYSKCDYVTYCLPLNLLNPFAQCVNSFRMIGSSDFVPDPKYLSVEIAKRLCCFHTCPLLKPSPDGEYKGGFKENVVGKHKSIFF